MSHLAGELEALGWNALDLTESVNASRSGRSGGGGARGGRRRPTGTRGGMSGSLGYAAAGVGTKLIGKAIDRYWPDHGYVGKMGRRRTGLALSRYDLQKAGRLRPLPGTKPPSGPHYTSKEEQKAAWDAAKLAHADAQEALFQFRATANRSMPKHIVDMETGQVHDPTPFDVEEWQTRNAAEFSRRQAKVRETEKALEEARRKPVFDVHDAPAQELDGDYRADFKKGRQDKEMRRYAREHRRRSRALRYARTMPAERFLSAFGTRWSNKYL